MRAPHFTALRAAGAAARLAGKVTTLPGCNATPAAAGTRRAAASSSSTRATATACANAHLHPSTPPAAWLGELRRYTLHPASAAAFLAATSAPGALALRRRLPFAGMWTMEAGGGPGLSLQTVTHLYLYAPSPSTSSSAASARVTARAALAADPAWGAYLAASRPAVAHQEADLIAVPAAQGEALAAAVAAGEGCGGGGGGGGGGAPAAAPGVFELTTLPPGAAGEDGGGGEPPGADSHLLLAGTVIAGPSLGTTVRLARHPTLAACLDSLLPGSVGGATAGGGGAAAGGGGSRALLRPVAWSPLQ